MPEFQMKGNMAASINDRVKRRGKFLSSGILVDIKNTWVKVFWDKVVDNEKCPRILHINEIETTKS